MYGGDRMLGQGKEVTVKSASPLGKQECGGTVELGFKQHLFFLGFHSALTICNFPHAG